jgi:2-polyprenyl-3-methyl-5-hydroxy-6-metoxy-1,4-benzoquinol methylase
VTASSETASEVWPEQAEAFVGRLFEAAVGGWELLAVHVGLQLGLYAALADAPGGLTTAALAEAAGVHPRYAQEWLEQQVISGVADVDDATAAPEDRTFTLPPAHAEVLLNQRSAFYAAPLADWTAAVPVVLPRLMEAYRTGSGLAWGDFGEIVLDGQAAFNRPLFQHTLAGNLATHLPDVDARLKAEGGRIADVACGYGWSSLALAEAYPKATVVGIDVDGPSVERARRNIAEAGVDGRVTATVGDAARDEIGGPYQLVTIFEALHDMSRPVEVLANIRGSLAPGGAVLVMDENVADEFGEGIGNPVERFMYTASLLCCLPTGMAEQPSAATGTVMRPSIMKRYAEEAGFSKTTELPIEDGFHRYYRLDV